jgi:hypothetical protein
MFADVRLDVHVLESSVDQAFIALIILVFNAIFLTSELF